jgi:hypothetical protein
MRTSGTAIGFTTKLSEGEISMAINQPQTARRYGWLKPANSKWHDGWLISMTSIGGFELVRHYGDAARPFVLSRTEWDELPEFRPGGHVS